MCKIKAMLYRARLRPGSQFYGRPALVLARVRTPRAQRCSIVTLAGLTAKGKRFEADRLTVRGPLGAGSYGEVFEVNVCDLYLLVLKCASNLDGCLRHRARWSSGTAQWNAWCSSGSNSALRSGIPGDFILSGVLF